MYDESYYRKHEKGSYNSAITILEYILSFYKFNSLIDLGCGMGTWCKAASDLGVENILGLDQHVYEQQYMLISDKNYIRFNLKNKLNGYGPFDIAISVEVAEHIDNTYVDSFIRNVCSQSNVVLFSAALPFQGGTGHINEKRCSFWKQKFNKYGYEIIDCIRPHFWDDQNIEIWYRNNCVLFVKNHMYSEFVTKIPKDMPPLDIIHPEMLERILRKRGLS